MTITHGMSRRQFLIGPDVARAIAVVDPATVSDEEIAVLKAAGVVGLRINLAVQGEDPGAAAVEAAGKATARVADHGLVVQIFADMPRLEPLEETIGTAPVPIALDHFAGAKAGGGTDQPGFAALERLLADGKVGGRVSAATTPLSAPEGRG
jgi:2-pyrone-4,6-dicarboxylate lactonase